jgi:hypothetical protein
MKDCSTGMHPPENASTTSLGVFFASFIDLFFAALASLATRGAGAFFAAFAFLATRRKMFETRREGQ